MDQQPPPNPNHVTPRQITVIISAVVIGLLIGFQIIGWSERRQARKRGRGNGLGHAVPQTFLVRETNGMVWVPSGGFYMGATNGPADQQPQHLVTLNGFWMDKTEVTIAQFEKFCEATGFITQREQAAAHDPSLDTWRSPARSGKTAFDAHFPVRWITWNDAVAYAQWAGKRLPTEAEWEYAARGSLDRRPWPWGDSFGPGPQQMENFNHKPGSKVEPVGQFAANGYGLVDMAGNVSEWCADWYDPNNYLESAKVNPVGPANGVSKVFRGASFLTAPSDLPFGVTAWRRSAPTNEAAEDRGFRCVQGAN